MSDICPDFDSKIPYVTRYPADATFELTVRCNLKCRMCLFRPADSEYEGIRKRELSASEWIDMAKQAAEMGTLSLLITGGEPMMRSDFCEIWEGIYKQGFLLQLYTNGTMVTPKIVETLKKYPPHKIGFTVYGASPETYERVCGNGRAYDLMLSGIRQLMELPSKKEFRSTIIKDNFADLLEIQELVHLEFGDYMVTNSRLVVNSVRQACSDVKSCRLSPEDNLKVVYSRAFQKVKDVLGDAYDSSKIQIRASKKKNQETDQQSKGSLTLFGCKAGMSEYCITWDGKLFGCQMLGAFSTDAKEKGLKRAWDEYPMTVKMNQGPRKCDNCELIDFCESCAATRYAESGSVDGFSDYICSFTKLNHKFLYE